MVLILDGKFENFVHTQKMKKQISWSQKFPGRLPQMGWPFCMVPSSARVNWAAKAISTFIKALSKPIQHWDIKMTRISLVYSLREVLCTSKLKICLPIICRLFSRKNSACGYELKNCHLKKFLSLGDCLKTCSFCAVPFHDHHQH